MNLHTKILDVRGEVHAMGSINDMMSLMRHRWAGRLVRVSDGHILFDVALDRTCGDKLTNRQCRIETELAWERNINNV